MFRLILIVVVFAFSCKSQKNEQQGPVMNEDNDLILLLEDAYFPADLPLTMTINNQKSLNSFFAKVNTTRKPGIPVPTVDFDKKMIIVVCAGEQKGIESLQLLKTNETESRIEIEMILIKNDIGKELTIYPFCVYKLPKTSKTITYK